jgi:hypothetical protein
MSFLKCPRTKCPFHFRPAIYICVGGQKRKGHFVRGHFRKDIPDCILVNNGKRKHCLKDNLFSLWFFFQNSLKSKRNWPHRFALFVMKEYGRRKWMIFLPFLWYHVKKVSVFFERNFSWVKIILLKKGVTSKRKQSLV